MHVHTGIHVKILRHYCIEACPPTERKIFDYNFGFIDNEDEKHYFRPGEYYDEEELYNDVIYKIYDYFHLMNDIKIIETDDDGNEYYVNKYVRKGKLVYYPCYRRAVKGFSYMLGNSPFNEYENKEGAIDHIEKHIEEKRRKKEWDRIFEEFHRELEEAYIEATSPVLDDSKIEGDEITYKKGRESITLKISRPE